MAGRSCSSNPVWRLAQCSTWNVGRERLNHLRGREHSSDIIGFATQFSLLTTHYSLLTTENVPHGTLRHLVAFADPYCIINDVGNEGVTIRNRCRCNK